MNRLIRIAGGTASGKTTIARKMAQRMDCLLIEHDRYYVDIPRKEEFNFDEPAAMDNELLVEHIDALTNNQPAGLPIYDFSTHSRRSEMEICQPKPLILLEGILTIACRELDPYSCLNVYVDAPADIRFIRRLKRDIKERGRTVDSVATQYLNTVRPMHELHIEPSREKADLILNGCDPIDVSLSRLAAAIDQL